MTENVAKIRLRIGQIEVEYEGESSFLKDDLVNLLSETIGLYKENDSIISTLESPPIAENGQQESKQNNILDFSTNTVAAKLGVKKGPELVIAAAAHLTFVKNKNKFTRKDLLDEMKEATTYYKTSHSANLSKSIDTLVKNQRFHQNGRDTYALSATEKNSLEAKLA